MAWMPWTRRRVASLWTVRCRPPAATATVTTLSSSSCRLSTRTTTTRRTTTFRRSCFGSTHGIRWTSRQSSSLAANAAAEDSEWKKETLDHSLLEPHVEPAQQEQPPQSQPQRPFSGVWSAAARSRRSQLSQEEWYQAFVALHEWRHTIRAEDDEGNDEPTTTTTAKTQWIRSALELVDRYGAQTQSLLVRRHQQEQEEPTALDTVSKQEKAQDPFALSHGEPLWEADHAKDDTQDPNYLTNNTNNHIYQKKRMEEEADLAAFWSQTRAAANGVLHQALHDWHYVSYQQSQEQQLQQEEQDPTTSVVPLPSLWNVWNRFVAHANHVHTSRDPQQEEKDLVDEFGTVHHHSYHAMFLQALVHQHALEQQHHQEQPQEPPQQREEPTGGATTTEPTFVSHRQVFTNSIPLPTHEFAPTIVHDWIQRAKQQQQPQEQVVPSEPTTTIRGLWGNNDNNLTNDPTNRITDPTELLCTMVELVVASMPPPTTTPPTATKPARRGPNATNNHNTNKETLETVKQLVHLIKEMKRLLHAQQQQQQQQQQLEPSLGQGDESSGTTRPKNRSVFSTDQAHRLYRALIQCGKTTASASTTTTANTTKGHPRPTQHHEQYDPVAVKAVRKLLLQDYKKANSHHYQANNTATNTTTPSILVMPPPTPQAFDLLFQAYGQLPNVSEAMSLLQILDPSMSTSNSTPSNKAKNKKMDDEEPLQVQEDSETRVWSMEPTASSWMALVEAHARAGTSVSTTATTTSPVHAVLQRLVQYVSSLQQQQQQQQHPKDDTAVTSCWDEVLLDGVARTQGDASAAPHMARLLQQVVTLAISPTTTTTMGNDSSSITAETIHKVLDWYLRYEPNVWLGTELVHQWFQWIHNSSDNSTLKLQSAATYQTMIQALCRVQKAERALQVWSEYCDWVLQQPLQQHQGPNSTTLHDDDDDDDDDMTLLSRVDPGRLCEQVILSCLHPKSIRKDGVHALGRAMHALDLLESLSNDIMTGHGNTSTALAPTVSVATYNALLASWANESLVQHQDPVPPIQLLLQRMLRQWQAQQQDEVHTINTDTSSTGTKRRLPLQMFEPTATTIQAALWGMARSPDPHTLEQAEQFFQKFIALIEHQHLHVSSHGENVMETKTTTRALSRALYETLMKIWTKHKRPEKVEQLFQELHVQLHSSLSSSESPIDMDEERLHATRLQAWSHAGNPEMTLLALHEWMSQAAQAQSETSGNESDAALPQGPNQSQKRRSLRPPGTFALNAVLGAWTKSTRSDAAQQADQYLEQHLQNRSNEGNDDSETDKNLSSWCAPNLASYCTVISAHAKSGSSTAGTRALYWLRRMQSDACGATRTTTAIESTMGSYDDDEMDNIQGLDSNHKLEEGQNGEEEGLQPPTSESFALEPNFLIYAEVITALIRSCAVQRSQIHGNPEGDRYLSGSSPVQEPEEQILDLLQEIVNMAASEDSDAVGRATTSKLQSFFWNNDAKEKNPKQQNDDRNMTPHLLAKLRRELEGHAFASSGGTSVTQHKLLEALDQVHCMAQRVEPPGRYNYR